MSSASESSADKISKTKLLADIAADVAKIKKVTQHHHSEIESLKGWIKDTLKPSLNTMRTDLLADIDGMKKVISSHQEQYKQNAAELVEFRSTLEAQRSAQAQFQNTIESKLVEKVEQSVNQLEEKIHKETERLWKLFEEHKPKDDRVERFMDSELDLLEARLEQHVFKEINRNTVEIEKDIQHVEERLEQVIFREVLRLKNALLTQKEEEEEAALEKVMPPKQKEVHDWLTDLGLVAYFPNFVDKGFDSMLVVRHIIAEDLDFMKITLPGHRKTLLLAVDILNPKPAVTSAAVPSANTPIISKPQISIAAEPSPAKPQSSLPSYFQATPFAGSTSHDQEPAPVQHTSSLPSPREVESSPPTATRRGSGTRGSLHKKPPVPKKPAAATPTQAPDSSHVDLPEVAPFTLVFDDEPKTTKSATAVSTEPLEDPEPVRKTSEVKEEALFSDEEVQPVVASAPAQKKERDILDEIEEEQQEKLGKARSTSDVGSIDSPKSKTRPPVASKPSGLHTRKDTGAANDGDWVGNDEEYSGADLMITQKPKRSSDMTDPHVVVDRIFNEEEDVSWALLKVEKGTVLVHKYGKGTVDELVENFDDSLVLFGYLRTFVGAEHRTKFVFIRWVGENITPMERAKAVDNKNLIIDEYLQFYHLELLANQRDEVTSAIVKDRLKRAGGANYDPKQNEGF